jgi:hypothetical protein
MTSRTALRAALGSAAVLAPSEASELLPMRDSDAALWLRHRGLVREGQLPDGRTYEYVLWREVEAALGSSPTALPEPQGKVVGLRRRAL